MDFGNQRFGCDEETTLNIARDYLDAGHNFIDTANRYADTRSEVIVGKAVNGRRDSVVVATKAAYPLGPGPFEGGTSRKALLTAVEETWRAIVRDVLLIV